MAAINGFSVGADRQALGITTYKVPGTEVALPVRREIAPLLIGLAQEFTTRVEPLRAGWCWGYAYRQVRGGSTPSFHAAGIAIDLNAPTHPLGKRGTFDAEQAATCRALARKYGCRWGGDYKRRADEMHFEVIVPRAEALGLVERLQQPTADARPAPVAPASSKDWKKSGGAPPYPGSVLRRGMTDNPHVRAWQARMRERGWRLDADGDFGPRTEEVAKAFQKEKGLTVDGLIGGETWNAAWSAPVTTG